MNETACSLYPSRPSDDLEELAAQLLACFEALDDQSVELARDLLDHGTVQVWRMVARGELSAPRTLYNACRPFLKIIERTRRRAELAPEVETTLGAHFLLRQLRFAADTLDGVGFELQLAGRRSTTEREVLRVLLAEQQRAESENAEMQLLRQGQVRQRMSGTTQLTPTRIGQVLRELHRQGFLLQRLHPDRGGKEVSFYGLAPSGVDLCKRLGLSTPKPSSGFDFSTELQQRMLDPRRVAIEVGTKPPPSRVAAFCSFSGGLGRTTAVAHTAWEMAARVATGRRLLVIDLDFDAPALDDFFACSHLGACHGLRGLVIDFYRQPKRHRAGWLQQALSDDTYVLQPFPEQQPALWYLPTGFGEAREECRYARELLSREVTVTDPVSLGHCFAELLPVSFEHTLIDCAAGVGDSAWLASMRLADHLLLYARDGDAGMRGMRPLLANFLARQKGLGREHPSVSFVSGVVRPTDVRPAASWAGKLFPKSPSEAEPVFRTLDLPFDPELSVRQADLTVKSRDYLEAISRLIEELGVRTVLSSLVLGRLREEMTANDPMHLRIVEGLLAGARNRELARDYFTSLCDPRNWNQLAVLFQAMEGSNKVLGRQQVRVEPARPRTRLAGV